MSQEEKQDESDFWWLAGFAAQIKSRFPDQPQRVFVASKGDFWGMKMAYYLYPANVYWNREGPELPPPDKLRAGDFIVLVDETETRFDRRGNFLIYNDDRLPVQRLLDDQAGTLFRVR